MIGDGVIFVRSINLPMVPIVPIVMFVWQGMTIIVYGWEPVSAKRIIDNLYDSMSHGYTMQDMLFFGLPVLVPSCTQPNDN